MRGAEAKSPRLKPLIKASDIGGSSAHVTNQEGWREGEERGRGLRGTKGGVGRLTSPGPLVRVLRVWFRVVMVKSHLALRGCPT